MKRFLTVFFVFAVLSISLYLVSCAVNTAHEHAWGEWTVTQTATCTADGIETRYCFCGEKESRLINKTAHSFGEWMTEQEPTCTENGVEVRICSLCNHKESRLINKTEHFFGEWMTEQEPTCTENGVEVRICSLCSDKETRDIDRLPHIPVTDPAVSSTCTQQGVTEGSHCKNCSLVLIEQEPLPLAPHALSRDGEYTCTVCDYKLHKLAEFDVSKNHDRTMKAKVFGIDQNTPSKLSIIGTGQMKDYNNGSNAPYYNFWKSIDEVIVGEGVTDIGKYAFWDGSRDGCSKKILLPESLKSINYNSFGNINIESINLPNHLETIASHAFACSNIHCNIVIPDSVTFIEDDAFIFCSISDFTFSDTFSDNKLLIEEIFGRYKDDIRIRGSVEYNGGYYIPSKTNPHFLLIDSGNLTTIHPNTRIIYDRALMNQSFLNLTIPDSVYQINENCFEGCSCLESISISSEVKTLSEYMFYGCYNLNRITINSILEKIDRLAFCLCWSLDTIEYAGTVEDWDRIATENLSFAITDTDMNDSGKNVVVKCSNGERIIHLFCYDIMTMGG